MIDWTKPIAGCENGTECRVVCNFGKRSRVISWDWYGETHSAVVDEHGDCQWRSYCSQGVPKLSPFIRNVPPWPVTLEGWANVYDHDYVAFVQDKGSCERLANRDVKYRSVPAKLTYMPE